MKVGTVIILYHPDREHVDRMITTLHSLGWPVVLVDNSPHRQDFTPREGLMYEHCPSNVGIAAAQNIGLRKLSAMKLEQALILDQDSQLTTQMLGSLVAGFERAKKVYGAVGAVGPSIVCEFSQSQVQPRLQKAIEVKEGLASVQQIIASGMLVDLQTFARVGDKEESLFIDGVDHEWCWRARAMGYHIIQCLDVPMHHRQGDARHRIMGLTFKRGAPVRLYYQARNVLILARRRYVPLYWKLRHVPALPVRWLVNRWCFPEGRKRGGFFWRGMQDGVRGKSGKLE